MPRSASDGDVVCRAPAFAGPNREGDYFAALLAVSTNEGHLAATTLLTADQADQLADRLHALAATCRRVHPK